MRYQSCLEMSVQKSYTIYNQPAETSEQYAQVRDTYDGLRAEGLASLDGRHEVSVARAAAVFNTDMVVSHWYRLFGMHIRVTVAYFAKLVGWKERRRRKSFFDLDEGLEALQGELEEMEGEEAEKLRRAIAVTIEDRQWRRTVNATMAGLCAA